MLLFAGSKASSVIHDQVTQSVPPPCSGRIHAWFCTRTIRFVDDGPPVFGSIAVTTCYSKRKGWEVRSP